ncbi:MAG: ketoacid CoA transferase [Sphingomonadaceae bacterium]|nr:ketoacid CoA transferase [Sphingomonadaceae bacterium]
MSDAPYSLADLCIVAAAEAWRHDGEILATGITLLPRLAAGLAKLSINPALMMTDGENSFVAEPVPVGPRGDYKVRIEGWAPFARTFDNLWSGKRHAFVAPVQIDRFGQTNISMIGDHAKPKAQMLGARGFPGNSIHHQNSYFFPSHSKRSFVAGEVDYVCGVGYNRARWADGRKPLGLDLRMIVTDLCVMDFGGRDHAIRLVSLHPGITLERVKDSTGFDLVVEGEPPLTARPSVEQMAIIAKLDPHDLRRSIFSR